MQIDLSPSEARLLLRHLEQHLQHLDTELVHTDKHQLQHALAVEIDSLRALYDRLTGMFRAEPQQALPDVL